MTREQIREVHEAVYEAYTLDQIYSFISNNSWSIDMFKLFVIKMYRKAQSEIK